MSTSSKAPPVILAAAATFIGIDYHKKFSVWHVVEAAGSNFGKGRVEHHSPHDFATLVRRWPSPHVGKWGQAANTYHHLLLPSA